VSCRTDFWASIPPAQSIFARNKMKATKFGLVKTAAHGKASQVLTPILTAIAVIGLISGLSACGSGAVGSPPDTTPVPSTPLAVSPPAADLFPDVPTTFTITGGKPGYSAFSSNSVVLPVTATLSGATFTVIPGPVTAETAVDITVRDTANASASAKATVKPATLNNQITFTPFAPTATGCGTNAICSGGDAQVVVKAAQNGVVLRNRPIRFDAFQGSFQFLTPGANTTVPTLTINTDDQGEATARLRVNAGVPTQVASLQTTDVTSGLSRRYNFNVVQQTDGKGILSVLPSGGVTIKGGKGTTGINNGDGNCANGTPVDFYIFGGSAPYTASSPLTSVAVVLQNGVIVPQSSVVTNGGSFRALVQGCGKVAFIVTDATGRTIETSTLEVQQGDSATATAVTASLQVIPSSAAFQCGDTKTISLVGGGSFTATKVPSTATGVGISQPSGPLPSVISVTRLPGLATGTVATTGNVLVSFSITDGQTIANYAATVPATCP
jgi:hypothetical protein